MFKVMLIFLLLKSDHRASNHPGSMSLSPNGVGIALAHACAYHDPIANLNYFC